MKTRCNLEAYARTEINTYFNNQALALHTSGTFQTTSKEIFAGTSACSASRYTQRTMCQNATAHQSSRKRKSADFSLLAQPKYGFMQHIITFIMPTEGKESSAKVCGAIFHSHTSRNSGERGPQLECMNILLSICIRSALHPLACTPYITVY